MQGKILLLLVLSGTESNYSVLCIIILPWAQRVTAIASVVGIDEADLQVINCSLFSSRCQPGTELLIIVLILPLDGKIAGVAGF